MYLKKIKEAIEYAREGHVNVYNWNETLKEYTVVAFGLGKFWEDTHDRLFDMCNIVYVSDNNKEKWGKEFYGKKCIAPEEIKLLDNPFVIAVVGYDSFNAVRDQMREMKLPVIHISEMHFEDYLKGKGIGWIEEELENIEIALDILTDEQSKNVFTNIFCNKIYGWNTKRDYEFFATGGEYFETDVFSLHKNEVFVDCGAYIGDTIEDFINKTDSAFNKIYTFELSVDNYNELVGNIEKYGTETRDKIVPINAGVWNKEGSMWYAHPGDMDGCKIVQEESAEEAKLVSLDGVISESEKVTVLKMDIEGAEQRALEGARRIIENDGPKLAICLYHRPEDLWQIPIMIKKYNKNYNIYIRHHSAQNYTDTVCYAYIKG